MRVVGEADWVDGVFAYGVDTKGAVCKDREGVVIFIGFQG